MKNILNICVAALSVSVLLLQSTGCDLANNPANSTDSHLSGSLKQGAKLVVFTSRFCKPCHKFWKFMDEFHAGSSFEVDGKTISVIPVVFEEVQSPARLAWDRFKTTSATPEIQLWVDNTMLQVQVGTFANYDSLVQWVRSSLVQHHNLIESDPLAEVTPFAHSTVFNKNPKSRQIALLGAGASFEENPVFVGVTLKAVRQQVFTSFHASSNAVTTLYGDADAGFSLTNDAFILNNDSSKEQPAHVPDFAANGSFTRKNIARFFKSVRENGSGLDPLLVFAGHGGPSGVPIWNDPVPLTPNELGALAKSANVHPVIVSGTCFGGHFASIAKCGFFAARPDTMAEGCSPSPDQLELGHKPTDYVARFFEGAATGAADFDSDKVVTLAEAHWYATINGSPGNATYTTIDALADRYYDEHKLGSSVQDLSNILLYFRDLPRSFYSAAEKKAFTSLWDSTGSLDRKIQNAFLENVTLMVTASGRDGSAVKIPLKLNVFTNNDEPSLLQFDLDNGKFKNLFIQAIIESLDGKPLGSIDSVIPIPSGKPNAITFRIVYFPDKAKKQKLKTLELNPRDLSIALPADLYPYAFLNTLPVAPNDPAYVPQNYRPTLIQLTRRILFKTMIESEKGKEQFPEYYKEYKTLKECEEQPVQSLFQ